MLKISERRKERKKERSGGDCGQEREGWRERGVEGRWRALVRRQWRMVARGCPRLARWG